MHVVVAVLVLLLVGFFLLSTFLFLGLATVIRGPMAAASRLVLVLGWLASSFLNIGLIYVLLRWG